MNEKMRVAVYGHVPNEEMPKTAIYCRVASANESEIKTQEVMLRNYASEKLLTAYAVFSDNGESGVTLDRPAFGKMMSGINNGEINCVIVKSLCRISRNHLQLADCLDDICGRNVRVIAVDDGYDSREAISFADL